MSATDSLVRRELLSQDIKDFFIMAVKHGNYDFIAQQIASFPSLMYARDSEGDTPLHIAAQYNDTKLVELLILSGADVNLPNNFGETPLHHAFSPLTPPRRPNEEIISLLIEKGADFTKVDIYGRKADNLYPNMIQGIQNNKKNEILDELWEIENNNIFTNRFQWFPRETKDDLKKLITSPDYWQIKPPR